MSSVLIPEFSIQKGSATQTIRGSDSTACNFFVLLVGTIVLYTSIWIFYGATVHETVMLLSNYLYILLALAWWRKGFQFIAFLNLGVFICSTNYHICYGRWMDVSVTELGMVCNVSMSNAYVTLILDVFFATTSSVAALLLLMPRTAERPEYGSAWRHVMTLCSFLLGLVTFWILTSNWQFMDFEVDRGVNFYIYLVNGAYIFLLYVCHFGMYGRFSLNFLKQYYEYCFHVKWLLFSLLCFNVSLIVWSLCAHTSLGYFDTHWGWHVLTVISGILFLSSFKRTTIGNTGGGYHQQQLAFHEMESRAIRTHYPS